MSVILKLLILLLNTVLIQSNYLDAKSNYLKPKERNNIVNKRVWVKNKNSIEKAIKGGKFVFGADSYDVEGGLVNDNDDTGSNAVPFISTFAERSKRSTNYQKSNNTNHNKNQTSIVKSKILSKLIPLSILNEYPYELSLLLNGDHKLNDSDKKKQHKMLINNATPNPLRIIKSNLSRTTVNNIHDKYTTDPEDFFKKTTLPQNNSKFQPEVIKKVEYDEELSKHFNDFVKANKIERDIFDKDDVWQQNPMLDITTNTYKAHKMPLMAEKKSKPVTERGLLKILSLLTKTFKKIMRQHDDVKRIHGILQRLNDEFVQNIDLMTTKFNDFDIKYMYLLKMDENIRQFETKFKEREQENKNKENELAKTMLEFANQQKKFLAQQQQFYNVQKLILMQNEKITAKQNMIARSQSDISRKQNNFARILKQVKQIFISKKLDATKPKPPTVQPPSSGIVQHPKDMTSTQTNPIYYMNQIRNYTLPTPEVTSTTTDPMKINLFSIVPMKSLENNDDQILKEKDEKPVDDLIYKYYFNNTFIDNLIKNKILANFIVSENNEIAPEMKNKREHLFSRNNITFLFPVLNHIKIKGLESKKRQKRWIRHHPKTSRKHNRGKETSTMPIRDDVKIINLRTKHSVDNAPLTNNYVIPVTPKALKKPKKDPFRMMAANFCKEIGQNINDQALKWCMEKALRRLKVVDTRKQLSKKTVTPTTAVTNEKHNITAIEGQLRETRTNTNISITTAASMDMPVKNAFPDNDQLESFLQQYVIKPDTEGNVYYEGSIHTSDMDTGSEGASDILPGLGSNSRQDPLIKVPKSFRQSRKRVFLN